MIYIHTICENNYSEYLIIKVKPTGNMDLDTKALQDLSMENPVRLDKRYWLAEAERKFSRACEQVMLLNDKLVHLDKRYNHAKINNLRCFRYNQRLQIAILEGTRNTYRNYALEKAKEVTTLRGELFGNMYMPEQTDGSAVSQHQDP